MSIISRNLVLLRKEAGLSITELSNKTGIKEEILIGFEEERLIPNEYQLEVLALALHFPYEDLTVRDISLEREKATKEMKSKSYRENYNWYFGNRRTFGLLLGYVIYFLVGVLIISLLVININKRYSLDMLYQYWLSQSSFSSYIVFIIYFYLSYLRLALAIFGAGVVVFFALDYFSKHTFYFRWWYILWLGLFLSLLYLVGIIGSLVYFVYVLTRLIRGKY